MNVNVSKLVDSVSVAPQGIDVEYFALDPSGIVGS
jgi:hypothetical protein